MQRLTPWQSKILEALGTQVKEDDVNFKTLGDQFGISRNTLREHLDAIARKGYLEIESRGRGRNPSIRLLTAGVPLIGQIAAGPLSEALEFPEAYLRLTAYPGRFGLRVNGHSMADRICDADVVILEKRPHKSGEICAVRVDRSDATLKYVDYDPHAPDLVRLRPHNPDYPTQEVAARQLQIDGVYASLLRGDIIEELLEEPVS